MNEDRISVNWCRNEGLRGRMRENRGEGECVWCMGLGARPERIPKASRRNGGRGNEKMARRCDEACKHIPMKETTIHKLGCLISYTTDRAIIYIKCMYTICIYTFSCTSICKLKNKYVSL